MASCIHCAWFVDCYANADDKPCFCFEYDDDGDDGDDDRDDGKCFEEEEDV